MAGGLAGAVSRTATAPFDRLKVYLIAQTKSLPKDVVAAAAHGRPVVAAQRAMGPFKQAVSDLWRAGGMRSFFAGTAPANPNSLAMDCADSARKWVECYQSPPRIWHQIRLL